MASATTFYDLKATNAKDADLNMSDYKGKVVLIVNTASKCGFTPQFEGLEALWKKYGDKGFAVLGFPCNQFASQDPKSDDEIGTFCQKNYGVTFPIMKKSDVNGSNTNEVFNFLKNQKSGVLGLTSIKWNFTKFLVDSEGKVVKRYSPTDKPESLEKDIEKLLPKLEPTPTATSPTSKATKTTDAPAVPAPATAPEPAAPQPAPVTAAEPAAAPQPANATNTPAVPAPQPT